MKKFPRSPYDEIGGVVYFRRMADKIRLQQAGELPDEYVPYLGDHEPTAFDGRCCRFLGIDYGAFTEQVKKGLSDDELFVWSMKEGTDPSMFEKDTWNGFMRKRGWRDQASAGLREEAQSARSSGAFADAWNSPEEIGIYTFFDLMDAEEGRTPRYNFSELQTGEAAGTSALPSRPLLFPDLRSPYETVGGIAHFGRMLDKIRLHQQGKLPQAWINSKGGATNYDGLCCQFLGVSYAKVEELTLAGESDEEVLEWVISGGPRHTAEEIKIWNTWLAKRNWRDQHTHRLYYRLQELGLPFDAVPTMFDYIDLDEGRPVRPISEIIRY